MADIENVILEDWIQLADIRGMLAKVRFLYFLCPVP
jgi:hypothetical protein